jgi:hypothetical protein
MTTALRDDMLEEQATELLMRFRLPSAHSPRRSAAQVVRIEPVAPDRWIAYLGDYQKARVFATKNLALIYARRLATAPRDSVLAAC